MFQNDSKNVIIFVLSIIFSLITIRVLGYNIILLNFFFLLLLEPKFKILKLYLTSKKKKKLKYLFLNLIFIKIIVKNILIKY